MTTSRKINNRINNFWKGIEVFGTEFFNVLPKLGSVVTSFFGVFMIFSMRFIINKLIQKSARNVIISFNSKLINCQFRTKFKEYKKITLLRQIKFKEIEKKK